jgi:uncharacterized membrane protein YfcA
VVDPSLSTLAILFVVAALAGTIDAIGGGGGLLTVPTLLSVGLPPHAVFATNKAASVFGSGAALGRFARAGLVEGRLAMVTFPLALLGGAAGAGLLLLVDPTVLRPLVLVLLVGAGVVLVSVPPPVEAQRTLVRGASIFAGMFALGIGVYDGFFGPGTGTFLIVAFVTVLHHSMQRASANAKVVNFGSNLASVILFAWSGEILWRVALPMALGQLLGGVLGAHIAVRRGSQLVRRIVLVIVIALVARLGWQLVTSP